MNKAAVGTSILLTVLSTGPASAQFEGGAASGTRIRISACSVYSTRDESRKVDCTAVAAKACDGQAICDLPIGVNLTDGRDIDSRSFKKAKVTYVCGQLVRTRGPYPQNDNATLTLTCTGPR